MSSEHDLLRARLAAIRPPYDFAGRVLDAHRRARLGLGGRRLVTTWPARLQAGLAVVGVIAMVGVPLIFAFGIAHTGRPLSGLRQTTTPDVSPTPGLLNIFVEPTPQIGGGPDLPGLLPLPQSTSRAAVPANPAAHVRPKPAITRTATMFGGICAGGPNVTATWWCGGAYSSRQASGYALQLNLSPNPPPVPGTLSFETDQEADFLIADSSGKALWTWSRGQSFADDPHTVQVPASGEELWTLTWDGTADDGSRIKPGSYTLKAISTANNLQLQTPDGTNYWTTTIEIQ